ncbi:hypothetical protein [Chitinophaga caseinilytica]|uniref:Uncharacterized protein n=1 Tax=Chitinophaga caseinilytica TaxID=2267521 RepID=A0ABZ2Z0M8_9BACT
MEAKPNPIQIGSVTFEHHFVRWGNYSLDSNGILYVSVRTFPFGKIFGAIGYATTYIHYDIGLTWVPGATPMENTIISLCVCCKTMICFFIGKYVKRWITHVVIVTVAGNRIRLPTETRKTSMEIYDRVRNIIADNKKRAGADRRIYINSQHIESCNISH